MAAYQAEIIHTTINREWREVYEYARQPQNMAHWAAGLAAGLRQEGDEWIGDGGPLGEIRVRFAPPNGFGVIDHDVTLPDGTVVHNALRVVPNGDGAEVMFTLIRQPGMDDAAFAADAAAIRSDLSTLRSLLETE
nr:polyketide cyclase [Rhizobium sp. Q54]